MTPQELSKLQLATRLVGHDGAIYTVTTVPRKDKKDNPYVYARSGDLVARISVTDCGHFERWEQ